MATHLTEEDKVKNIERFWYLIDMIDDQRRDQIKNLFETSMGMSYFTSPASTREEYHDCYPGGLLNHSLTVAANIFRLAKAFHGDNIPWSKGTMVIAGLFHDFGKAGDGEHQMYLPHDSDWHRSKGMLYKMNPECLAMPNAELGLYVMQLNGIKLSSDEWIAIRLNDGQYDESNSRYAMKEPELALLTHWADMRACVQDKEGE